MSESPILRVDQVSKKFARSLKKAMVFGLGDIAKAALMPTRFRSEHWDARLRDAGRANGSTQAATPAAPVELPLRDTEFWAVRNVSFDLHRGECLGLIGHNGAGKSTILKMLSGIYGPTQGSIAYDGNLSALLEVGAGFSPMLSGRENIYISGSIRGMTNDEIERKYDQIVAFSGVEEFIDMPIKFYSSGMLVRLGFAVLAHLEPDILLIDEILAVGDMEFQKKCIDHVTKLRQSDMALMLISHSLYRIESLCSRCIWLEHGQVMMEGDTKEVVKAYRDDQIRKSRKTPVSQQRTDLLVESAFFEVRAVELLNGSGKSVDEAGYGDPLRFCIRYRAKQRIEKPLFHLAFRAQEVRVFESSMLIDGDAPASVEGEGEVICEIPQPQLLPNNYTLVLSIRSATGATELIEPFDALEFGIGLDGLERLNPQGPYALGHLSHGNLVYQDYSWDLTKA
jgi:ABC-type polysaccharide/polyol phosphate transport system ATPase subunit